MAQSRLYSPLLGLVLLFACSAGEATPMAMTIRCSGSRCREDDVCVFGLCHQACRASADCAPNERCLADATSRSACLPVAEEVCHFMSDCEVPLTCAPDRACRNACAGAGDCLQGQLCAKGGVCAEPSEVTSSGQLLSAPAAGGAGGAADQ
jgi:hypothetical protein